jgi:hypothetical protein
VKKILLCAFVCSFSFACLHATIKDDSEHDSRITALLQKVEKLKHPFYRPTFDTLIKQTVQELQDVDLEREWPRKIKFLGELLDSKVKFSCMTDTDMSDIK